MHGARRWRKMGRGDGGRGRRAGACRWKFANLAAISRPLWIRYRCRSSRTHSPLPLQSPRATRPSTIPPVPPVVGWLYATRAWRALVLFSARAGPLLTRSCLSFRLSFHCRCCLLPAATYRVADAVIVGPRIAADKIAEGSFESAIETADARITARVTDEYVVLHTADRGIHLERMYNVARGHKTYGCRRLVSTRLVAAPKMDIAVAICGKLRAL